MFGPPTTILYYNHWSGGSFTIPVDEKTFTVKNDLGTFPVM
jgi:hypothetical protein